MSAVGFVSPMLVLSTNRLPDDPAWAYEIKLDGYRAIAFNADGELHLRSRNDNDFGARYPTVLKREGLEAPSDVVRRFPYAFVASIARREGMTWSEVVRDALYEVYGIGELEELPRPEAIGYK